MKRTSKKMLALVLTFAMALTLIPASAENSQQDGQVLDAVYTPVEFFRDEGRMSSNAENNHATFTIPLDGGIRLAFDRPAISSFFPDQISFAITLHDAATGDLIGGYTNRADGELVTQSHSFFRVSEGQEVFVRVRNSATTVLAWDAFDYSVTATFAEHTGRFEIEPNNTIATATNIVTDAYVIGNLSNRDDVDWFRFTLEEIAGVTLTFRNPNLENEGTRWAINVFDAEEFALFDFVAQSNTPVRTLPQNPHVLPAGTYYVRVRNASTSGANSDRLVRQDYRLTVNTESVDFCRDCGRHDGCICVETVPCWNCEADVFTPFCGQCGSPVSGPPLPGDCGCVLHMLVPDGGRPSIQDALQILRFLVGLPNVIDGTLTT
jgi:hypothetical protein